MSTDSRLNDIILITERLIAVLERENAALRERRNTELHALLDDKVTLSRVYETRMQFFNQNPEALVNSPPELREKLREMAARISTMLQENAQMLKTAITANRRVVDMIAEAVRNVTPGAGTYGANGMKGLSDHKSEAQGLALSFDQTL
ncbi:MAG: flagellar protein FlgN [Rhodospirillales bacterium]|nr:flagellar protein FlgN [Rhodospirillales bacterium]